MVYGFLKASAIGLFAGFVEAVITVKFTVPYFQNSQWGWSVNANWAFYPLVKIKLVAGDILEQFVPDFISMQDFEGCKKIALSDKGLHELCCGRFWTTSYITVSSTIEEVMFRMLIQRLALLALEKAVPKKVKGVFSHTASRIVIGSAIFAIAHDRPSIMPYFLQGLAWGIIFENCHYGLYASSVGHSMGNIFKRVLYGYPSCRYQIAASLSK